MEALHGREYSEMLALLDGRALREALAKLDVRDARLGLDLAGRDPDLGFGEVAYEKGYLFFRMLEETIGREALDGFLRGYFERHAFRSMTTRGFLDLLRADVVAAAADPAALERELRLEEWIYGAALPQNTPRVASAELERVAEQARAWLDGRSAGELARQGWTAHHHTQFLRSLPPALPAERLAELDEALGLSRSGNAEVLSAWLRLSLGSGHAPADALGYRPA